MTEGQYSPVRLKQARLVHGTRHTWHTANAVYFAFKRTFGQLNSKDFRRLMTGATRKEQATTTLKTNLLNIFRKFYQPNLRLSFLDWEPN